jgi:hypothetical protein
VAAAEKSLQRSSQSGVVSPSAQKVWKRKRKVAGGAKITYTLLDIGKREQLFAERDRDSGCIKITLGL